MHTVYSNAPRHAARSVLAPAVTAGLLTLLCASLTAWTLAGVQSRYRVGEQVLQDNATAEAFLSTLKDAETGQRGFLLTGDKDYLEPYLAARAKIGADAARLRQAWAGHPEEANHLALLNTLTEKELAELERTVKLREDGQSEAALAIVRDNEGKNLMDAARAEVDSLHVLATARVAQGQAGGGAALLWILPFLATVLTSVVLGGMARQWQVQRKIETSRDAESARFSQGFGLTQSLMRDFSGRITFWGPGMEGLYGYTDAMAVGMLSHSLLSTRFPLPLAEIEAALLAHGDWNGELTHRCMDGTTKTVMSHWMLYPDGVGRQRTVVEMNFDITAMRQAETHLQIALDAARLGTWNWEIGTTGEVVWDARTAELCGVPALRSASYSRWQRFILPEDIEVAEAGLSRLFDPSDPLDDDTVSYRVRHPDGTMRWVVACRHMVFVDDKKAAAGRVALRLAGTLCDITTNQEASLERERTSALLHNIVETTPGPIYAKDCEGRYLLANAAALTLLGRTLPEVLGRTDMDLIQDPQQAARVMSNDRQVIESGKPQALEEVVGGETMQARVWLSTKTPMRSTAAAIIGLVGVSVEITERKRDETRRELMIHELNHRVKNTLATVQAVASETLQGADPAMRAALSGRLLALAGVHDILTRESWHSADTGEVVAAALAPFGGAEIRRFSVRGPQLQMLPRAAVAVAMGLHELATNATKYGALHVAAGRVSLTWEVTGEEPQNVTITWIERGGPQVENPSRRSFGTNMIENALAGDLGGVARIYFEPEGVRCVITAPLDEVVAPADEYELPRLGRA